MMASNRYVGVRTLVPQTAYENALLWFFASLIAQAILGTVLVFGFGFSAFDFWASLLGSSAGLAVVGYLFYGRLSESTAASEN